MDQREPIISEDSSSDHIGKCGHKLKSGATTNRGSLCELVGTNHERGASMLNEIT